MEGCEFCFNVGTFVDIECGHRIVRVVNFREEDLFCLAGFDLPLVVFKTSADTWAGFMNFHYHPAWDVHRVPSCLSKHQG